MAIVSVLVPIYNVENYIERCVRSLFEQTFNDIEYVFVNDCTPDHSADILKKIIEDYPERKKGIKLIEHTSNRGIAAVRNTLSDHATGDFVLYVDSDDYLENDAVELLYQKAQDEKAEVVVFDMNYVYSQKVVHRSEQICPDKEGYIGQLLCREVQLGVCGKLILRDIMVQHRIRYIEGVDNGEDYMTMPRIIYYANKVVKMNKALYNYVVYNQNSYTKCFSRKTISDVIRANQYLCDFFSAVPDNEKFRDVLLRSKIRNKIWLLEYCMTKDRRKLLKLYPETKGKSYKMPLKHRLVWRFAESGSLTSLNVYISVARFLKNKFSI